MKTKKQKIKKEIRKEVLETLKLFILLDLSKFGSVQNNTKKYFKIRGLDIKDYIKLT